MSTEPSLSRRLTDLIKRLFDILVSLAGLICLSPLFAFIALNIRRDSPGPVFYRGQRAGLGGKTFRILKFRTMYERPESYQGPPITAQDDPRITPLGHWLRRSKLNELPQLWNVLKGEMSLVGPRPEDPEIVKDWPEAVRREVLSVRPGITSPASVLYRHEETLLQNSTAIETYLENILPSKLRLDQLYVHYRSFWNDLDVLFSTLLILLPRAGSYIRPEKSLFLGPIQKLMRRFVSWFTIDWLVTLTAIAIAGIFWRSFGPLNLGWRAAILLALGFSLLFSLVNVVLRVNRIEWARASATDALDLLPGTGLAMALALLFNQFYPQRLMELIYGGEIPTWVTRPLMPPGLIGVATSLAFLGFLTIRYRSRVITGLASRWARWRGIVSATQERILIVGGGETGQFVSWMLSNGRFAGSFRIVGFVDDDLYKQGSRIHGIDVLGQRSDIPELVSRYNVGIIIFAIHNITTAEKRQLLNICSSTPARVFLFPNISAALMVLSRNGQEFEHPTISYASQSDEQTLRATEELPCHLCLLKTPLLKVDRWLTHLDEVARSGDWLKVQTEIQALRDLVREEMTMPYSTDPVKESD